MDYKLFSDGGARSNPGPAASSAILFDSQDNIIWFDAKYLGATTNNIAEYEGFLMGLTHAKKIMQPGDTISCFLDSELVVKQLNGEYKIKNEGLKPLFDKISVIKLELNPTITHVERAKNSHADRLVNICLDAVNEKP